MPTMGHMLWLVGGILLGWLGIPLVLGMMKKNG